MEILNKFTLYWLGGKSQVVEGGDIADAMNRAGYGGGAVRALDFFASGDKKGYEYNAEKKDWIQVKPTLEIDQKMELAEIYELWDELCDIPTDDNDKIEEPFLDFKPGAHREDIWHWFEDQNSEFLVGDVQSGIRKNADALAIVVRENSVNS